MIGPGDMAPLVESPELVGTSESPKVVLDHTDEKDKASRLSSEKELVPTSPPFIMSLAKPASIETSKTIVELEKEEIEADDVCLSIFQMSFTLAVK